jgi:SAM-dependent methyltransferase
LRLAVEIIGYLKDFYMALDPSKASPAALRSAAERLIEQKKYDEAEKCLVPILQRDRGDAAALALAAQVFRGRRQPYDAMGSIVGAVNADPAEPRYRAQLIDLGEFVASAEYSEPAVRAITTCLESGDNLDFARIRILWVTLLFNAPAFKAAFRLGGRKALDPANKAHFESLTDFSPLFTPFFLLGIRHIIIGDLLFEEFFTHVRLRLFRSLSGQGGAFTPEQRLALAAALSFFGFNAGYILDDTQEEREGVEKLRARIESGAETDPAAIALFACYAPLYSLKNADRVEETFSATAIADVIKRQVSEYRALRAAAAQVEAITPIDDAVSAKVRAQYEEFPYPEWRGVSRSALRSGWQQRNGRLASSLQGKKTSILNAGCGTGNETSVLSAAYPQADILAVDLSRTSLAYATAKAKEYGLNNITFRQADILRLGGLNRKFDHISTSGVLHHMEDPVKGWRVLRDLLKPDGTMLVGLYSKVARAAVLETQAAVKARGYGSDTAEMKRFRRESPQFLPEAVFKNITGFRDYYIMPMYRDLLFHVQEHDYDLADIKSMLGELKMEFLGFSLYPPVLQAYAKAYPEDKAMSNLDNWRDFEEKHPRTFIEMYNIWCRKAQ